MINKRSAVIDFIGLNAFMIAGKLNIGRKPDSGMGCPDDDL